MGRRQHPLYMNVCLSLMAEVINSRLFTTVRDALGLTYDVSFELHNFDQLDRAKRNLLTRHDSDMKDNGYWVSLLTHLQNDLVPNKDIGCLQDLVRMYDEALVADIYEAYGRLGLSEEAVYSCVGVSGPNLAPEDSFATAVAAAAEATSAPSAGAPSRALLRPPRMATS